MSAPRSSSMACKSCSRLLELHETRQRGVVVKSWWEHATQDVYPCDNLVIVPASEIEEILGVCDFCCGPDPAWDYPASDFEFLIPFENEVKTYNSIGDWAACEGCHETFQKNDMEAMVRKVFLAGGGGEDYVYMQFYAYMAPMFAALRQHLTGDPVPSS